MKPSGPGVLSGGKDLIAAHAEGRIQGRKILLMLKMEGKEVQAVRSLHCRTKEILIKLSSSSELVLLWRDNRVANLKFGEKVLSTPGVTTPSPHLLKDNKFRLWFSLHYSFVAVGCHATRLQFSYFFCFLLTPWFCRSVCQVLVSQH